MGYVSRKVGKATAVVLIVATLFTSSSPAHAEGAPLRSLVLSCAVLLGTLGGEIARTEAQPAAPAAIAADEPVPVAPRPEPPVPPHVAAARAPYISHLGHALEELYSNRPAFWAAGALSLGAVVLWLRHRWSAAPHVAYADGIVGGFESSVKGRLASLEALLRANDARVIEVMSTLRAPVFNAWIGRFEAPLQLAIVARRAQRRNNRENMQGEYAAIEAVLTGPDGREAILMDVWREYLSNDPLAQMEEAAGIPRGTLRLTLRSPVELRSVAQEEVTNDPGVAGAMITIPPARGEEPAEAGPQRERGLQPNPRAWHLHLQEFLNQARAQIAATRRLQAASGYNRIAQDTIYRIVNSQSAVRSALSQHFEQVLRLESTLIGAMARATPEVYSRHYGDMPEHLLPPLAALRAEIPEGERTGDAASVEAPMRALGTHNEARHTAVGGLNYAQRLSLATGRPESQFVVEMVDPATRVLDGGLPDLRQQARDWELYNQQLLIAVGEMAPWRARLQARAGTFFGVLGITSAVFGIMTVQDSGRTFFAAQTQVRNTTEASSQDPETFTLNQLFQNAQAHVPAVYQVWEQMRAHYRAANVEFPPSPISLGPAPVEQVPHPPWLTADRIERCIQAANTRYLARRRAEQLRQIAEAALPPAQREPPPPPIDQNEAWLADFYRAMEAQAQRYGTIRELPPDFVAQAVRRSLQWHWSSMASAVADQMTVDWIASLPAAQYGVESQRYLGRMANPELRRLQEARITTARAAWERQRTPGAAQAGDQEPDPGPP